MLANRTVAVPAGEHGHRLVLRAALLRARPANYANGYSATILNDLPFAATL